MGLIRYPLEGGATGIFFSNQFSFLGWCFFRPQVYITPGNLTWPIAKLCFFFGITYLVSTYLFVRCNNHKCVTIPLWRGNLTWLPLDHSTWRVCLLWSLARGSFWYKCPLCTFDLKFLPHPPSPSFYPCFIHSTRTHIIPSHLEQVFYERRNHLRIFRLGLTRVLHFKIYFSMDGSFEFHTQLSQWNPYTLRFLPFDWRSVFRFEILEKNASPWEDSDTLDGGHEPKIQPMS